MKIKKSALKSIIQEALGEVFKEYETVPNRQVNELVGRKPEIGQGKFDYLITYVIKDGGFQGTSKSLAPLFAKDEAEAKQLAIEPFNPKVVDIKDVRVTRVGEVTAADLADYEKKVQSYAYTLRPKNQGGWGAD
jgi:hypothetical protein